MPEMFKAMNMSELAEATLCGNASVDINTRNATHDPCMNPPMNISTIIAMKLVIKSAAVTAAAENKLNNTYAFCTDIFIKIRGPEKRIINAPIKNADIMEPASLKSIPISRQYVGSQFITPV
ncbi:hypothetical protein SDC9_175611 [bioreactor metagenome]|uniref:Uncharacterized protein n=1 Tax=bioreactor metagenome TaxID=1076179 RepID=A0A645GQG9_9ZZZZ